MSSLAHCLSASRNSRPSSSVPSFRAGEVTKEIDVEEETDSRVHTIKCRSSRQGLLICGLTREVISSIIRLEHVNVAQVGLTLSVRSFYHIVSLFFQPHKVRRNEQRELSQELVAGLEPCHPV